MLKEVQEALSRLTGDDSDKVYVQSYIKLLERENRALIDDNEVKCDLIAEMKKRIFGLEQTVANCREKEEKMYRDYSWKND